MKTSRKTQVRRRVDKTKFNDFSGEKLDAEESGSAEDEEDEEWQRHCDEEDGKKNETPVGDVKKVEEPKIEGKKDEAPTSVGVKRTSDTSTGVTRKSLNAFMCLHRVTFFHGRSYIHTSCILYVA